MKKNDNKNNKMPYIVLIAAIVVVVVLAGIKIYVDKEYKPLHTIEEYQELTQYPISQTDNRLTIRDQESIDDYFNVGVLFYSGERINGNCYLPLMAKIANEGYDCFLPIALGNMPFLNLDGADQIINKYKWVTDWYLVAHSTACEMAVKYANGHEKIKGIILLGGYPNTDISKKNIRALSIIGSRDTLIDMKKYEESKLKLPKGTIFKVIEGGNHTAFADTTLMKGDTKTSFKPEKQIEITAQYIIDFIG